MANCVVGSASRAVAAADQCSGKYGGTFSGTADLSTGPAPVNANATFNGTIVVAPVPAVGPQLPAIPGFPIQPVTYYKVESGSLHFRISGTLPDGCHLQAEGDVDLAVDLSTASQSPLQLTQATPTTYNLRFQPPLTSTVPGTISACPDPSSDKATVWPVAAGVGELIHAPDNQPLGGSGEVAGTFAGRGDPSVPLQTWTWNLTPQ